MINKGKINAFLVDDEPLAIRRLEALLLETDRVNIVGTASNPRRALEELRESPPDVIFLDIQMPGLTGFELLEQLDSHPPVVFTTAFDEHSLNAFEYFSVDYLLKPISKTRLIAALDKLDRIASPDFHRIGELLKSIKKERSENDTLTRLSSRVGSKIRIINVDEVSHFYAEDKITFAVMNTGESRPVDLSLNGLESDLDKKRFMRVHRSTIVNLDFVKEVHGWFAGKVIIRLKDDSNTELTVARSRVRRLKSALRM